jgi:predicted heme/steroid binding protein
MTKIKMQWGVKVKKVIIVMSVLLLFTVTAVLISCSSNKSNPQNPVPQVNNANNSTPNKTFTLADLKNYTGQNGNPAYVAVNGNVYDVTTARKWRNGRHENGIVARVDLTNMMGQSPHGTSVLSEVPVVGSLK